MLSLQSSFLISEKGLQSAPQLQPMDCVELELHEGSGLRSHAFEFLGLALAEIEVLTMNLRMPAAGLQLAQCLI